MSQSPLAPLPPPRRPYTPPPPHCGLGGGVGQPCLVANIHPGPEEEYCIWQHRVLQTCSKQAHGSFQAGFFFDFL